LKDRETPFLEGEGTRPFGFAQGRQATPVVLRSIKNLLVCSSSATFSRLPLFPSVPPW
jgi:hypothetical protein